MQDHHDGKLGEDAADIAWLEEQFWSGCYQMHLPRALFWCTVLEGPLQDLLIFWRFLPFG